MNKFGKELVRSAEEALAIAEGRSKPARVLEFDAVDVDVAAIRKRLRLTQAEFAGRFGLAVATVRDWEQKRRRPDRIASNLLRVIDLAPDVVDKALAS